MVELEHGRVTEFSDPNDCTPVGQIGHDTVKFWLCSFLDRDDENPVQKPHTL